MSDYFYTMKRKGGGNPELSDLQAKINAQQANLLNYEMDHIN
jgi:hypothetical protein